MTPARPDTVASLRERLLQLQAARDAGTVDAATHDAERASLEGRLAGVVLAGEPQTRSSDEITVPPDATAGTAHAGARLWLGVLVSACVVAAGGYAWTGSPSVVGRDPGVASPSDGAGAPFGPEQIAAMVGKLAARLEDKPDDIEGWRMLGRSYVVLGKPAEASAAFQRALALRPGDASTLSDYADALAALNGNNLEGEPSRLLVQALQSEPDNLKALMLTGTAAYNRGDPVAALQSWRRMAQVGPVDHPLVEQALLALAEIDKQIGAAGTAGARSAGPPPAPGASAPGATDIAGAVAAAPATGTGTVAAGGASAAARADAGAVSGTVSLAPTLAARAAPDDTVFIFARPAAGPGMPLAIVRTTVRALPFAFRLDDNLAMSPATRISGAASVVVGARISRSGQAMPQTGDLQALSAPVAVGSRGLVLVIDDTVR